MKKFIARVEETVVHEFEFEAVDEIAAYLRAKEILNDGCGEEIDHMHEVDSKGLDLVTVFEAS